MVSSRFWVGIWVHTNCSVLRNIKTNNRCGSKHSLDNSLMSFLSWTCWSCYYNRVLFDYYLIYVILWDPSNWDVVLSGDFVNSETSKNTFRTAETIAITSSCLSSRACCCGFFVSMVCCLFHIVCNLAEFSFSPIHKLNSWGGWNWSAWRTVASSFSNLSVIITSLNGCWIVHDCHGRLTVYCITFSIHWLKVNLS